MHLTPFATGALAPLGSVPGVGEAWRARASRPGLAVVPVPGISQGPLQSADKAGVAVAGSVWALLRARRGRSSIGHGQHVKVLSAVAARTSTRQPVTKGKVSAALPVPPHILRPPYVDEPDKVRGWWNSRIEVKSLQDVKAMRAAGRLAHAALDLAGELIAPGRTTEEIETELHHFICAGGAYPSDLFYKGFPKSVMISVNEVICHGIPDNRPLENGDLVNVDVTLYLDGFHADTARTWVCGETDDVGRRLVDATKEALDAAIAECRAGAPMKAIGAAVSTIAEREGFGVVKTLVGHGIGEFFHGAPQVFHCRNSDNRKMQEGTTFTIEPVLTEGSADWITWADKWTVATKDGGRAAQFEHTLLITADGCEVLT